MIEAQKLTKIFDGKKALNGVDIKINSGSIYGLVGSNGSGKSTLLRLISGIYKPDGGSITIDGNSVFNNAEIKAGISYLGDTPYFLPGATINETAKFYRSMYKNFDNALFHRLLEIFPLDYKAKIAAMSKGMQRQAGLILALSTAPEYLFLDETFDGLDFVRRRMLAAILRRFTEKRNACVIVTSHYLNELEKFADSLALIEDGRMIIPDTGGVTLEEYFMAHTEVRADEIDTLF